MGNRLVPHAGVGDVAELILALLGHGAIVLDYRRQRLPRQDGLSSALIVVRAQLLAQVDLHLVDFPVLKVRQVRGSDAPASVLVAKLPNHDGTRDVAHLDKLLPRVLLF